MPILPALISGGTSLLGTGLNAISTGIQNRRSQQFSRQMYGRQKADNIELWNMQNAYNDPSAQMARLKKAGLNPALMYGSSSSGASGTAGTIPKADIKNAQFNSPDTSGVSQSGALAMNHFYNLETQKAQLNNLKKQNTVLTNEALLKAAQAIDVTAGGNRKQFDLKQEQTLARTSIDYRKELLRQITNSANMAGDEVTRKNQLHPGNMRQQAIQLALGEIEKTVAPHRLQKIKAEIGNIANDTKLKQFEIKLNKMGFSKNDAAWQRVITTWADRILKKFGYHSLFKN